MEKILKEFNNAKRILITGHINPDEVSDIDFATEAMVCDFTRLKNIIKKKTISSLNDIVFLDLFYLSGSGPKCTSPNFNTSKSFALNFS